MIDSIGALIPGQQRFLITGFLVKFPEAKSETAFLLSKMVLLETGRFLVVALLEVKTVAFLAVPLDIDSDCLGQQRFLITGFLVKFPEAKTGFPVAALTAFLLSKMVLLETERFLVAALLEMKTVAFLVSKMVLLETGRFLVAALLEVKTVAFLAVPLDIDSDCLRGVLAPKQN